MLHARKPDQLIFPRTLLCSCNLTGRSATIVAAYLMHTLSLTPDEALELIRSKRPVIEPSRTFLEQLEIYWDANCRVSNKDKGTRRWFLERTQESVMSEYRGSVECLPFQSPRFLREFLADYQKGGPKLGRLERPLARPRDSS